MSAETAGLRHARNSRRSRTRRRLAGRLLCLGILLFVLAVPAAVRAVAGTSDEIHYTFTGPTSVAFDWRGTATDISYGVTTSYGSTATAQTPSPLPRSSSGPFQEVALTGLTAGTTYHYSIGGGADNTFTTAPTGSFRFDVIGDVGSSLQSSNVSTTQNQIAADSPAFVLMDGDLTYGDPDGQAAVDQHFNDVMAWSQRAAYMPAWGNHEWQTPTADDLRNYKGRFVLPNPITAPAAPAPGCCGEDSGWFDAGGVRFISYPDRYSSSTWSNWQTQIDPVFAAAQADPAIHFIVTYGHRPAYSTGFHPGDRDLAGILDTLGDRYSKYALDFNGHSHDYERYQPIHGVTHITAAGGGYKLEAPWSGTDVRTAFRAMHLEHVRVDVSSTGMRVEAVCGPPTAIDDMECVQGSVIDTYVLGTNPPPPPPPPAILYVDKGNPNCSNTGSGTATQPFCSITPAASRAGAGQTVLVSSGTYSESLTVSGSGTASAPLNFVAAPGATVVLTGVANGIYISGRSYVSVQGFDVTRTTDDGIVVKNSSNITLFGNHVSYAGQPVKTQTAKGMRIENTNDSVISGNTVDHNTAYGIYLDLNSTRNQVQGNMLFNNAFGWQRAASGIRIHSSPANTISSNISHDNEDSGIEFDKSSNNLAVNNVTYNNGDHGIDTTATSTGARLIANTVYKNVTSGINIEGTSTGATVANNISVDNGIASPRSHSNIRVETGSTSGTTLDYDLVNLSSADVMVIWNNVNYNSLAAFKSATGQETRGVQADPKWKSQASGDFHLLAGSPAIDNANSGASGQPSADAGGAERDDDPATPNTGVGPRAYDDRGAYEYDAPALDHIVISPSSATTTAGSPKAFTVQGFDASGNSFGDVTASTTFSISSSGSCTGNSCTATTAGLYTVTADDEGKTSSASLTVTAAALDHLVLAPASATITAGGSKAYTAAGRDLYENSLGDVTSTTTFTIGPNGSCTGATCTASIVGAHTVTGTKAGKTGTATLQVTAGTLDHIVISPSSATISAGGSRAYTVEGFDASNNSLGDVTANTTFTIAPDGSCTGATCTATAAGSHTVTGNDGGKTSTATLTVNAGPLDHLALSPASASIGAGGSQAYTAAGRDQYDNPLGDVTSSTTFTIGPNGSCGGATCTATSVGAHTVTGTSAGKSGTASLAVTAGTVDHLVLTPASASIVAGGSQTYTSEARDQYENSLGDATADTTFTIAPDGSCTIASCSASTAGPHSVTGTLVTATGTASLAVTAGTVDHIVISPTTATIAAGGSRAYTVEGFDASNNSLGDVTANTTFTIAPDGSCTGATCTATAAGSHTVTGNDGGKTSTATLTVNAGPLDHLALSPASASIGAGGSQAYTAAGRDQYDNPLGDVTSSTTFTIGPNGSCGGATCTATSVGAHTVTGTSAGKSGTASLAVTAGTVDHIVIS
ncbi:MAG: right-handed parallel beta-helix repeat-containing protein, partial [Thermoleophilia bacterium]